MAKSESYKRGDIVLVETRNGQEEAEYISKTGGWTQVRTEDGAVKKVRNSAVLELLSEGEQDASVISPDYKRDHRHVIEGVSAKTGRKIKRAVYDNADVVATGLRDFALEETYALANDMAKEDLRGRYGHLNPGMQRMNLGRVIRAILTKGEDERAIKVFFKRTGLTEEANDLR